MELLRSAAQWHYLAIPIDARLIWLRSCSITKLETVHQT